MTADSQTSILTAAARPTVALAHCINPLAEDFVGDKQLQSLTQWLLGTLADRDRVSSDELIKQGTGRYSPSDITWAIWYLKSEGKLRLTKDDLIAAA